MDDRLKITALENNSDPSLLARHRGLASRILEENPILDRLPAMVVVLNQHRKIIYYNDALLAFLDSSDHPRDLIGATLGEVMGCSHLNARDGGCGRSEFCKVCGAVQSIISGLAGHEHVRDCAIARDNGEAMELRVWAMPVTLQQESFVILSITDISSEKRRQVMERIFFHDLLNTAGSIRGIAEVLVSQAPDKLQELTQILFDAASHLVEEISWQKILMQAESGLLHGQFSHLLSRSLLEDLAKVYRSSPSCRFRVIRVVSDAADVIFQSDATILRRVLGNMVKNALEAIPEQGTVTLDCRQNPPDHVCFSVHNPTFIPKNVQMQIFHRSFSTKGQGRGLGTYSIRLLTQRYLHGEVVFSSSETAGTTFQVILPQKLPLAVLMEESAT